MSQSAFYDNRATVQLPNSRAYAIDRRTNQWRTALHSLYRNRRVGARRGSELAAGCYYVDVHEPRLFYAACATLLLCTADAFFTLTLLGFFGSYELNPIMDYLLQRDVSLFFFAKFAFTALGVLFLVMHKNFRLLNRISGQQILYASVGLYAVLVFYELYMLVVMPVFHYLLKSVG